MFHVSLAATFALFGVEGFSAVSTGADGFEPRGHLMRFPGMLRLRARDETGNGLLARGRLAGDPRPLGRGGPAAGLRASSQARRWRRRQDMLLKGCAHRLQRGRGKRDENPELHQPSAGALTPATKASVFTSRARARSLR